MINPKTIDKNYNHNHVTLRKQLRNGYKCTTNPAHSITANVRMTHCWGSLIQE